MNIEYRKYFGPLCAFLAFGLYLFSISPGAFPGDSAKYIADYSGLSPFLPILHPLWWLAVRAVAALPLGSLSLRLNLFSAVCGALAVWLVYAIVSGIAHDRTAEEHRASFKKTLVRSASGIVAAAFLATTIPFWIIATRAHPASFDILIPLMLVHQLQCYSRSGNLRHFYIVCIGLGLGLIEFPSMLVLALPIYLALIYLMFRHGLFANRRRRSLSPFWKWLFVSAGLVASGTLPALAFAAMYRFSPAYAWRDFPHFLRLLVYIFRNYIGELTANTNQLGWILVLLVSLVPLLVVLIPKREQKRDHVLGSYFFHLVLSAVALVVVFNLYVSPWALYGYRTLVITPYLLMAVWVGYLGGYWLALATRRHRSSGQGRFARAVQKTSIWVLPLIYAGVFIAATVINLSHCDGKAARPVQRLVREVVSCMEGRKWLVSNGALDDMLKVAAAEAGVEIEIVNPRLGASRPYLRYLSTRFDNPRLKGLALLGLSPLLQEWLKEHPDEVESDLAILSNPDLWLSCDYRMLPNKLVYFGRKGVSDADDIPALEDSEAVWNGFECDEAESDAWPDYLAPWNRMAVRHVGKMANNTGYALQNRGDQERALRAYKAAYRVDPGNVSALLNISSLADSMELPDREEWNDRLAQHVRETGRALNSWNLSYMYGYVYEPMVYVNRGLVWAMSGKPDLGAAEIKRAMALGGRGEHLKLLLAGMYFLQNKGDQSEELFLDVLEDDPDSIPAIRGLLRINVTRGRFDIARGYLPRLREAGLDEGEVLLEESILESIAGNKNRSKDILKDLIKSDASNLKAWNMLALIATEQNDRKLQQKCLDRFRKEGKRVPRELLMAMAQVALTQRETGVARRYIDQLLHRQPRNEGFLEWRLRIDVYEFNREEAEKSVERLMSVNPRNGFANYIMGTLHIYRDQFALAEPFLRVSVEQKRSVERLNTFAYVLFKRGKYQEAGQLVKEALDIDPRHGPAWDTYGMLLYQEENYDEAMIAILRALDYAPDNPEIRFHLAKVYAATGENQKALDVLNELSLKPTQFSRSTYDDLSQTANRVREKLRSAE